MNGEIEFSEALDKRLKIINIKEENIFQTIDVIKTKISDTLLSPRRNNL